MEQHIQHKSRIPEHPDTSRLDQIASLMFPQYSRSRLQIWIKNGSLKVDGRVLRPRDRVLGGAWIEIDAVLDVHDEFESETMALDICHEDDHLLVVNKPAGLVTHPAPGHYSGTLLNGLIGRYPELALLPRAGLVHRLDQDTSGLLVVARNIESYTLLVKMMQERLIKRHYEGIVYGVVEGPGRVDVPIARHPTNRKKMAHRRDGRIAVTHYRVTRAFPAHSHLSIELETGRTHQIRVHMAHIRHPLVGDVVYSGQYREPARGTDALKSALRQFNRQALHARRLILMHPVTEQELAVEAPRPDDFSELLRILDESLSADTM